MIRTAFINSFVNRNYNETRVAEKIDAKFYITKFLSEAGDTFRECNVNLYIEFELMLSGNLHTNSLFSQLLVT